MSGDLAFTLKVTMDSDWHIGCGAGRAGAIDRLVDRDADELPFVPATTIRGMWRDAAERLAWGLDMGALGEWSALVQKLFGGQPAQDRRKGFFDAPVGSALSVADARFDKKLREAVRGKHAARKRLRDAFVLVKPGVGVSPASGRARPDFLRFEEMARAGAELSARGSLSAEGIADEDLRTDQAFLMAAAALVERLGGKRRRGAGSCRLEIAFGEDGAFGSKTTWQNRVGAACDRLEGAAPHSRDTAVNAGAIPDDPRYASASAGEWVSARYQVTVETPVCAPADIQGNIVTTLDFIPGVYLLPWVTDALATDGVDKAAVFRRIAAGDVRVSPAYPMPEREKDFATVFPLPLSFFEKKGASENQWVNAAQEKGREELRKAGEQYKGVKTGFVTLGNETVTASLDRARKVTRTHNTVDDVVQRPTEDVGGVYSYEAIAPGVVLTGSIRVRGFGGLDAEGLVAKLRRALERANGERHLRVGRAGKAGYGRIRLDLDAKRQDASPQKSDGKNLIVWCRSDVLLPAVTEEGASTLRAVADAVAGLLGSNNMAENFFTLQENDGARENAQETQTKGDAKPDEGAFAFARLRRYESWSSAWAKPRPTLTAIAAGSVFVLQLAPGKSLSDDERSTIEREGLGVRKAEGYGAVLVDPPLLSQTSVTRPTQEQIDDHADQPDHDAPLKGAEGFPREVERAAWKKAIADAAESFAADRKQRKELGWTDGKPSLSQIGALRAAMGAFGSDGDMTMVREFAKSTKRAEKFGDQAVKVLKALVGDNDGERPARVWELLGLNAQKSDLPAPLAASPDMLRQDGEMWRYAVAALLWASMHYEKRTREGLEQSEATRGGGAREAAPAGG